MFYLTLNKLLDYIINLKNYHIALVNLLKLFINLRPTGTITWYIPLSGIRLLERLLMTVVRYEQTVLSKY